MKFSMWLLLLAVAAVPLCAKPKVAVKVTVTQGRGRDATKDALSKNGISNSPADMIVGTVWFFNVTLTSDDGEAVAQNGGHWCITGDAALDIYGEYPGTLSGNSLDVEVPAKKGKTKTLHFEILDHKWRALSNL